MGSVAPAKAAVKALNVDDEIVYLDPDNVIRVFDPKPTSQFLQAEWASPEGGWGNFALGDVTGDGDEEIIAIRQVGDRGRLTVFDPVAQDSPVEVVQFQNEVPWTILYDVELEQPPRLVATGEFDPARNGVEILYSFAVNDDQDQFIILHSMGDELQGRSWEQLTSWTLDQHWTAVATGDMYEDDGVDEVALVSFLGGEVGIFRVIPDMVRTFTNVNLEHRWSDVAFGNYTIVTSDTFQDGDELGAVRDADDPLQSSWVFRYDGVSVVDFLGERISPSPNVVFFVDISGNGDEEMVLLRQVRQELGPRPRLIIRDGNSNDAISKLEDLLDGDNEYKGGDGGDVDGDGKGEIVLIRDNRIRIYDDPQSSMHYDLIERFTNGRNVMVGNIDLQGLAAKSRLQASDSSVGSTLPPGRANSPAITVLVADATKSSNIPFTMDLEGVDGWATVTESDDVTPVELSIAFKSEGVQPGRYQGRIVIDAQTSGVDDDPLYIDLALTVRNVVQASPAVIGFIYDPCDDSLAPQDQTVELTATSAISYTTQIEGNPSWVTVAPEAGMLPENVVISVDPSLRPSDSATAELRVTVDLPREPSVVSRFPIYLTCVHNRVRLPAISP